MTEILIHPIDEELTAASAPSPETAGVIAEAEGIVLEAEAAQAETPLHMRTKYDLFETWASAERTGDTETANQISVIFANRIAVTRSSEGYKTALIDRYVAEKDAAKIRQEQAELSESPTAGAVLPVQDVASKPSRRVHRRVISEQQTVDASKAVETTKLGNPDVAEPQVFDIDRPLDEAAREMSSIIADVQGEHSHRQFTNTERNEISRVASLLAVSPDLPIPTYVRNRIMRASERIDQEDQANKQAAGTAVVSAGKELVPFNSTVQAASAPEPAPTESLNKVETRKSRIWKGIGKFALVFAALGAVIGGVNHVDSEAQQASIAAAAAEEQGAVSEPANDPVKPIEDEPEPEPAPEPAPEPNPEIPTVEERTLALQLDGNIWNSSKAFLEQHGYVADDMHTAELKNAILADLGLTEEGAHYLPVGFESRVTAAMLETQHKL